MYTISIIIPVYNCEKYIDRCLSSIEGQSYKELAGYKIEHKKNYKYKEKHEKDRNYYNNKRKKLW